MHQLRGGRMGMGSKPIIRATLTLALAEADVGAGLKLLAIPQMFRFV